MIVTIADDATSAQVMGFIAEDMADCLRASRANLDCKTSGIVALCRCGFGLPSITALYAIAAAMAATPSNRMQ